MSDQVSTKYTIWEFSSLLILNIDIEKSLQLTQNFMVVFGFDSKPTAACQTNKTSPALLNSILLQDLQIKSIFGED